MVIPVFQSHKMSVKAWLLELIGSMSEDQCKELAQQLKTFKQRDQRTHPRRSCSMPVEYATQGEGLKDFISDVSCGGVFIETRGDLDVGEQITLSFSSPDQQQPTKIKGEIVRKNMLGVGIRFRSAIQHFDESSWIDCRRGTAEVSIERRSDPRVEFKCPVFIEGLHGERTATDLSLGGTFVECEAAVKSRLQPGQRISLLMRLPTQDELTKVKAEVTNLGDRGIGCKFIQLGPRQENAIRHCFDLMKHTLPLR